MSISDYSCKAVETGSGSIRTATCTVGKVAALGQLRIALTPEQMVDDSVMVALAMLMDAHVQVKHEDCGITTTFFRGN